METNSLKEGAVVLFFQKVKSFFDRLPTWAFALTLLGIYVVLYFFTLAQLYSPWKFLQGFWNVEFAKYIGVGFAAQIIDGALGMAYGVSASSFLLSVGVSPASASASVHIAEVFTTGASAASHFSMRNVNKRLFKALVVPGVLGAITGAYILTSIDGDVVKPFVSVYLGVMGVVIISKAISKSIKRTKVKRVGILALIGGFVDSIGGGGWGPVVTSTLLSKGRHPVYTIGTVNATEFFVAFSSAGVFTLMMGMQNVQVVAGLVVGGVVAAPFGAYMVGKIKPRILMMIVGALIIFLSLRTLIKYIPF